ncbi:unnamed protein product [Clavelina lepadiformis]|uniref:Uncharacterized protein n=1 Tax=Clavelina lepadiformis TaxID=159417 RepID=A0ABP0FZZ1_CLALP
MIRSTAMEHEAKILHWIPINTSSICSCRAAGTNRCLDFSHRTCLVAEAKSFAWSGWSGADIDSRDKKWLHQAQRSG